MELGSVVVVPAREGFMGIHEAQPYAAAALENRRPFYSTYSTRMPVLGNDILQSWIERVRKLGAQPLQSIGQIGKVAPHPARQRVTGEDR